MEVFWKQGKTESRVKYSKSRLRDLKGENDRCCQSYLGSEDYLHILSAGHIAFMP